MVTRRTGRVHMNILSGNKIDNEEETVYESGIAGNAGVALAIIKRSEPHFHRKMTEYYMVDTGKGMLFLDGERVPLQQGDVVKIEPNTMHHVESKDGIYIWVVTLPPFDIKDLHRVDQKH